MKPLTKEECETLATISAGDAVSANTVNLFARLLDEVGRARALLKRIEWSASDGFRCPACDAYDPGTVGKPPPPHDPGCELAALLGKP